MAKYYTQQGPTKKQKRIKKFRFLFLFLLFIIFVISGVIVYDAIKQMGISDTASKSTAPITSTVQTNTELHSSPFFQFRTPSKWRAVPAETTPEQFIYRQYNASLIEQELKIEVNSSSQDVLALTQTTRVLPVTVSEEGFFDVTVDTLEHCKKALPAGSKNQSIATFQNVRFACNPTGSNFVVVVGLVGGTNTMSLPRPGGGTASYRITYRNLTATPSGRDFTNIIESFETR